MIEVRQSWRRLCLVAPFYDRLVGGLFFGGLLVTLALALAGVWAVVPLSGAAILLFEIRSAGVRMRADGSGIHIRNRLGTHDVAWSDVRAITVSEKGPFLSMDDIRPILRVRLCSTPGAGIAVYAAMGMGRAELEELARRLVELGRDIGFELPGPPVGPAADAAGP